MTTKKKGYLKTKQKKRIKLSMVVLIGTILISITIGIILDTLWLGLVIIPAWTSGSYWFWFILVPLIIGGLFLGASYLIKDKW